MVYDHVCTNRKYRRSPVCQSISIGIERDPIRQCLLSSLLLPNCHRFPYSRSCTPLRFSRKYRTISLSYLHYFARSNTYASASPRRLLPPAVKKVIVFPHIKHPFFSPLPPTPYNITTSSNMASNLETASIPTSAPGENYEVRQTHSTEDYTPDPSKSLPLSPARQALVDDILDLYSCKPTIEKVKRYTPDCVYDDQFVYANDRYKMAGQWFALPKLFKESKTHRIQIVKDEPGLIQFRNEQVRSLLSIYIHIYISPFKYLSTHCTL